MMKGVTRNNERLASGWIHQGHLQVSPADAVVMVTWVVPMLEIRWKIVGIKVFVVFD